MTYQPNRWSCLPTAWSYVIGWPVWAIIKAIGHDGSELLWHNLPEPNCRRGFHPQELIYLGDRFGFVTTTFEPLPVLESPGGVGGPIMIPLPFEKILKTSNGVLTGMVNNQRHAIAWLNGKVLDPSQGRLTSLDGFQIQTYYRIKSKWWSPDLIPEKTP
jgi:hypothetical protein